MRLTSHPLLLLAGCLALASCGSMKSLKQGTTAGVSKLSKFSFSNLVPAQVGIVEVREKDLQEYPLGPERALAYAAKRDAARQRQSGGFWNFFKGPVDFHEPSLPSDSTPLDGSLLPPKTE